MRGTYWGKLCSCTRSQSKCTRVNVVLTPSTAFYKESQVPDLFPARLFRQQKIVVTWASVKHQAGGDAIHATRNPDGNTIICTECPNMTAPEVLCRSQERRTYYCRIIVFLFLWVQRIGFMVAVAALFLENIDETHRKTSHSR